MKSVARLMAVAVLLAAGLWIYVSAGAYPVGADVPHSGPVYWALARVRDRSVAAAARGIRVPADLEDPVRLAAGAGHYASMCSRCHLAPGYESSETREGLYPRPPRLSRGIDLTPAKIFWVVKHGLKFSAMPAWGKSHSDEEIWDLTAFVLRLPHLTAAQYKEIVAQAPRDPDMINLPMPGGGTAGRHSPDATGSTSAPGGQR